MVIFMGFKDFVSKTKDKLNQVLEKGNSELKKILNTKFVTLYSHPVVGGFVTKKAFFEDQKLLFPVNDFDEEDIQINTIIGLDQDEEYYVITSLNKEIVQKTIVVDDKSFTYDCYEASYDILNDAFTNDVDGLPFHELSEKQEKVLNEIKEKIEQRSLAMKSKKDFCLNLWQFFVECIEYQKKDHYIVIAFSRIASEYVEDYSTYLIELFS